MDERSLYVWNGRITGDHPILTPKSSLFTGKLVEKAHHGNLHRRFGLKMTKIRLQFWILKLQQLANKVIHRCYSCKKFGTLFRWRTTRDLPKDRAEGYIPFQEVEADFAGPIAYKIKGKKEGKAYIILFYNRLSRALYL